ncbi:MAG: hypothetical protein R2838_06840 [Caldilineaceae bacterium]
MRWPFVTSLRAPPPSPYRAADGSLTPAAAQGREVFRRLGCNVCHGGAAWSDSDSSVVHNLGAIGAPWTGGWGAARDRHAAAAGAVGVGALSTRRRAPDRPRRCGHRMR